MPLRPSWMEAFIDGRKTDIASGPKRRTGSMVINVFARDHNTSRLVIKISAIPSEDGKTVTITVDDDINGYMIIHNFDQ